MSTLALRRIRLVGFHNFEDVTIDVDGHLFLVGDNESGKTTALDAVHLALSGQQDLDWNAAARMAGRRDEGRGLAGAVLRADRFGQPRRDGGISYVVLELAGGKRPMTLLFGAHAPSMDAQVQTWGAVGRWSAAALRLTEPREDGLHRVRDLEELAPELGRGLQRQIGRYRTAVADQIFGGRDTFDRITRLWRLAKSYRELARAARQTSDLLRWVLPAPDPAPFALLRKGLRDIREIEAHLRELQEEVMRLRELEDLLGEARDAEETLRRYHYVRAFRRREQAALALGEMRARKEKREHERRELDAERAELDERLRSHEAVLGELRSSEAFGLARSIRHNEESLAEEERRERAEEEQLRSLERRETQARRRADVAGEAAREALDEVRARIELARRGCPPALEPVDRALGALLGAVPDAADRPLDPERLSSAEEAVRDARRAAEADARSAQEEARQRQTAAEEALSEVARQLEDLGRFRELLPPVPGLRDALVELEAAGLEVEPLYRRLELYPGLSDDEAAAVETALGAGWLSTLVAAPDDVEAVCGRVLPRGDGLPVLEASPIERPASEGGPAGGRRLPELLSTDDPRVRAHLEAVHGARWLVAQPAAGGRLAWLLVDGTEGGLGARRRLEPHGPELVGEQARARTRERERSALLERRSALERELERARLEAERAGRELDYLEGLARDPVLVGLAHRLDGLWAIVASTLRELASATRAAAEGRGQLDHARERVSSLRRVLAELREQARGAGADEVVDRVRAIEQAVEEVRVQAGAVERRLAVASHEIEGYARDLPGLDQAREEAERALFEVGQAVRQLLQPAQAEQLHAYVMVTKQGARLAADVDQRIEAAGQRAARARAQLEGADGVLEPSLATRYGFRVVADPVVRVLDREDVELPELVVEREQEAGRWNQEMDRRRREVFEQVLARGLTDQLRDDLREMERTLHGVNRVLERLVFGESRFRLHHQTLPEFRAILDLVRRQAVFDAAELDRLRAYLEDREGELLAGAEDDVPVFLDYRRWFEFSFSLKRADQVEQTMGLAELVTGSGGAQAVQHYLLLFALATLLYDHGESRLRPLMMDEAFYGLDPERKALLLRCAHQLGLELVVATPDLDGTALEEATTTTVLIERDEHDVVRVAPITWEPSAAQGDLFAGPRPVPVLGRQTEPQRARR
jgi:hypothetical protein